MDMNDRSLRNIVLGLGGKMQDRPRDGGFDITAASEVMAMLCLANDLQKRLDPILVCDSYTDEPIYAKQR